MDILNSLLQWYADHQESYQRERELCHSGEITEGEKYPNVWNAVFPLPTHCRAYLVRSLGLLAWFHVKRFCVAI